MGLKGRMRGPPGIVRWNASYWLLSSLCEKQYTCHFLTRSHISSIFRQFPSLLVQLKARCASRGHWGHSEQGHYFWLGGTNCPTGNHSNGGPCQGHGASSNLFPQGQCTWWANERYHQVHGSYVSWTTNANAWQWPARAAESGWHVSGSPEKGAIIALQAWVQGAYGLGHVGVVEQVLPDGKVVASNMNWGAHPSEVTNWTFSPGPGVMFLWC
jgi:surface antigen